jgi:cytoskeleton protein RodZ
MNSETSQANAAPAPAAPAAASSAESPGTLIRAARENAHLSLDDLATQTRLARATLDALERDDFAALLEPVYVRGYYRKCAKVLNLPETQLMAAYASRVQPKPLVPPAKLRLGTGSEGSARRFSGVLVVALIAVLAGVVIWYLRGEKPPMLPLPISGNTPSTETAVPQTPADPAPAESLPGAEESAADQPSAAVSAAPEAAAPAAAPAAAEVQPVKPAATAPISTTPGSSQLLLNFISISWARVEDANGRVLLNRVVQAGERQVLDGKPPYAVFLGNAPAVQVEYQGAAVDIKALIRDSATARFTVPLPQR